MYKDLFDHIDKFWPKHKKESFTWELGPIKDNLPNFSVYRISPKHGDESWIYLTHGAWEVQGDDNCRHEFFLMTPNENPVHVETLTMLVNFHADPKYFLQVGSCVQIGRGWLEDSIFDHLLVSIPYPLGPNFETCELGDGRIVRHLWLLPVSGAEKDFLAKFGLEELEKKFDEAAIDFLDPNRPSIA